MPGRPLPTLPGVLILGAGPAGLALAFELRGRGVESLVLERGPAVGQSWATMPTRLKLVSPWKANWLPGSNSRRFSPNHEMSGADYAAELQRYAKFHELPVITDAGVSAITRLREGGFEVRTGAGTFRAPLLVNATGCFANPFTPEIPGARQSSLPQFHFATYRDAERLRELGGVENAPVLIVGKRLSAGQTLVELVDAGLEVALSCRGPIQFGAGPIGHWIFFRIHPALERLKLRLNGGAAQGFPGVMPGGRARQILEGGRVKIFPEITRFEDRRIFFADGRMLNPRAVVYATGFRPALGHLASLALALDAETGQPALRGFESAAVPGLFFLGLDRLRNFRSRFIRGIREDAPRLAEAIARRSDGFRPGVFPNHPRAGSETGAPIAPERGRAKLLPSRDIPEDVRREADHGSAGASPYQVPERAGTSQPIQIA